MSVATHRKCRSFQCSCTGCDYCFMLFKGDRLNDLQWIVDGPQLLDNPDERLELRGNFKD